MEYNPNYTYSIPRSIEESRSHFESIDEFLYTIRDYLFTHQIEEPIISIGYRIYNWFYKYNIFFPEIKFNEFSKIKKEGKFFIRDASLRSVINPDFNIINNISLNILPLHEEDDFTFINTNIHISTELNWNSHKKDIIDIRIII